MATEDRIEIDNSDEWPEAAPSTPGFFLAWTYKREWLPLDLASGLVIFAVTVPAALAYGEMAGLDAVNGLYACLVAMGLYAIFGTSRQLVIGAEAAVAVLVASSLASAAAGGDPARYLTLATLQALLAGTILVLAGAARVGFIADFVPRAVIVGFLNGMALIIILSQVGKMLGLKLRYEDFFPRLWELITKMHHTHPLSLMLGGACLIGLFLFRRLFAKVPEAILVVVLATLAVLVWDLKVHGVKVVGSIPAGLPHLGIPSLSFHDLLNLLPISVGVAFVAYMDTAITGRNFATKGGYRLDPHQEMIALGLANIGNAFTQGFMVGSSHSRTAVNDLYGGNTQLAGFLAAVFLALFLLFFTPILKNVPVVALAAIIIMAGMRLFNLREVRAMLRRQRRSGYLCILTSLAVLATGLMNGILIAVALSIVMVLQRIARPHETITRPLVPGLLVYRFAGQLVYFNADHFANQVRELIKTADPPVTFFLIDASAMPDIDLSAAQTLEDLYNELKGKGIVLGMCSASGHLRQELKDIGLTTRVGGLLYHNVSEVVETLTAVPVEPQAEQATK
jgi:sulfate permease, SulP family